MSRFFATGDTDSDSAGESSEEEQQPQKPVAVTKLGVCGVRRCGCVMVCLCVAGDLSSYSVMMMRMRRE